MPDPAELALLPSSLCRTRYRPLGPREASQEVALCHREELSLSALYKPTQLVCVVAQEHNARDVAVGLTLCVFMACSSPTPC